MRLPGAQVFKSLLGGGSPTGSKSLPAQTRGIASAAVAITTMAMLAGCTATGSSQANATAAASGGPGPSAYQAPTNNNSLITFAARPTDLSLAGVDPCSLLSAPQQEQLGVSSGTSHGADPVFKAPACVFQLKSDSTAEYGITAVMSRGIDYWLNQDLIDNLKQVTVGGYPALDVTTKISGDNQCSTAVSVADGQMLVADWGLPPQGITAAVACAKTDAVAAAALTTLRAGK